jgi:flavodoxin
MKALVVYQSYFGNTERIAQAIGGALAESAEAEVVAVEAVTPDKLHGVDLLVVGAPTRGFKPTEPMIAWLDGLDRQALNGLKVAAFDTRIALNTIESGVFRWMVKAGGFAAPRIAKSLKDKGGELVLPAEGFAVDFEGGPTDRRGTGTGQRMGRAACGAYVHTRLMAEPRRDSGEHTRLAAVHFRPTARAGRVPANPAG